ncbi:MAG: helix-turn-helix domain-containing protein [Thermodesulfobacteriota bacterium]
MEVILEALGKEIKWIQAADILGVTPRHIRRLRAAYQEQGIGGLYDGRRRQPSKRRAPLNWWKRFCAYTTLSILTLM